MKLKLTLPLPTSINKLYVNQSHYNPKTKSYVSTGKRILSKEGRFVKSRLMGEARIQLQQNNDEWDYDWTKENFVYQDATIYFNRKGRDDNNVYKLLNDSLEKIVYDNDSRVLVRTQKVLYDYSNPRIEITLTPVDYIGIFDNKEQLNNFEEKCMTCSKYLKGRCSILNDSKDAVVREEIDNLVCSKYKLKKSK